MRALTRSRATFWSFALLAVSLLVRHAAGMLAPIDYGYADLHVYVRGAQELFTGALYTFGLEGFGPFPLGGLLHG
ncbi:hypothetical protein TPAU25S_01186 [Tsukamurella paurometabola]|uniref:hypothetical protein n=1 Tax=Tsukamurella paurometabola TaxID=2061 RepID=UPI00019F0ED6|nr:hypothetical protein [Tsukamurella paurometabola]SUP38284.1 mannosyltransferase [Tsukamurella paurometabola]